jgi:dienelactone hydrolase
MAMTKIESPGRISGLATRRLPSARPFVTFLRVTTVVQGVVLAWLVGREGTPFWRTVRVLVVAAVTVLATAWEGRLGRRGRGLIVFLVGIVGTVTGAGIGPVLQAKAGFSVTTAAAFVTLATGLSLMVAGATALVRSIRRWWRLLAVPAGLLVLMFVLFPLTVAVNVTNRPPGQLGSSTPADHGLAYRDVGFRTSDGVRLSAWYIPSRNGAAVVLLHGAGSTRSAVLDHAVVLARHGYGVLLLDSRGHGESGGHAMDFGWWGDRDIAAAVTYLDGRPDVRDGRIGAVGMSMGGEQAIAAAGVDPRILAVVAEGTTGMQLADHGWLGHYGVRGWITKGIDWVTYQASELLSGAPRPMSLRDAIAAAAPRPVLLIAAGDVADESIAGRFFREGSPRTAQLWVVPGAAHTGGLATRPAEWEAQVTRFLDGALGSR